MPPPPRGYIEPLLCPFHPAVIATGTAVTGHIFRCYRITGKTGIKTMKHMDIISNKIARNSGKKLSSSVTAP
jgi:hypothetical protein